MRTNPGLIYHISTEVFDESSQYADDVSLLQLRLSLSHRPFIQKLPFKQIIGEILLN